MRLLPSDSWCGVVAVCGGVEINEEDKSST